MMLKYDGLVIYQHHDEEGILEVIEKHGLRSLHFGSSSMQSCIDLDDPEALQLPYARAMCAWLMFKPAFARALVVGLGGGSLTRFLLHHFPESQVDAVEYRESVVNIAHSHFGLPFDPRLSVVVDDGEKFVRQANQDKRSGYDLIFLDAFDVDGMAQSLASIEFFDACKNVLQGDGILVVNLWSSQNRLYRACVDWLQSLFVDKVLVLPVRNRGNVIVMAFGQHVGRTNLKELKEQANRQELRYQIELPLLLKDLVKQNPYNIHTVVNK